MCKQSSQTFRTHYVRVFCIISSTKQTFQMIASLFNTACLLMSAALSHKVNFGNFRFPMKCNKVYFTYVEWEGGEKVPLIPLFQTGRKSFFVLFYQILSSLAGFVHSLIAAIFTLTALLILLIACLPSSRTLAAYDFFISPLFC